LSRHAPELLPQGIAKAAKNFVFFVFFVVIIFQ